MPERNARKLKPSWLPKPSPKLEVVTALAEQLSVTEKVAKLLLLRDISNYSEAKNYFRPSLDQLHNPLLMKGMNTSVSRVVRAIETKEKVLIYGDYDVDGVTSVALVYSYLLTKQLPVLYYIPDRQTEGYGFSDKGISYAQQNKVTLIIVLDCGIKEVAQCRRAKLLGIDVIIGDHHLPGKKLPEAFSVLNPKQAGCTYPFKELCGCGIGFKLIQAVEQALGGKFAAVAHYLALVATAIAADIVPLNRENRVLMAIGLKVINNQPLLGLRYLFPKAYRKIDTATLVFFTAPRINAAGRMNHAKKAVELLLARNDQQANHYYECIETLNNDRKEQQKMITEEAIAQIEQQATDKYTTLVYHARWHQGILGIVASKLVEVYHRPAIVLTRSNDYLVGSARSVATFDLYQALQSCSGHLLRFGGHKFAAGLTLEAKKIAVFEEAFEAYVAKHITAEERQKSHFFDLEIEHFTHITPKFCRMLRYMAPFGPHNMQPVFKTTNCQCFGQPYFFGKEKVGFRLLIRDALGHSCSATGFNFNDIAETVSCAKPFTIYYSIDYDETLDKSSCEINLRDLCPLDL